MPSGYCHLANLLLQHHPHNSRAADACVLRSFAVVLPSRLKAFHFHFALRPGKGV